MEMENAPALSLIDALRERSGLIKANHMQGGEILLLEEKIAELSDSIGSVLVGQTVTVSELVTPPIPPEGARIPDRPIQEFWKKYTSDDDDSKAYEVREFPRGSEKFYIPHPNRHQNPITEFKGRVIGDDPVRSRIIMRKSGIIPLPDRIWVSLLDDDDEPLVRVLDSNGRVLFPTCDID